MSLIAFARRLEAAGELLALARAQRLPPPVPSPLELARLAGFAPDRWQEQVLTSTAPHLLINAARQTGKSTTVAVLGVHAALAEPGALVLLVSPTLRQSGELALKCRTIYAAAGRPVDASSETRLSLELDNHARIVSLPGSEATVRGYSAPRLLVVDEASRVSDALYYSLRPMLATSGGRLIAMSTPAGTRGWWYEAWRSTDDWEHYEVAATQCPRISPDFLAAERASMGERWYLQEYCCAFLEGETQAFRTAAIAAAFDGVEAWDLSASA